MDTKRLYEILVETCTQYRNGAVFEGSPHLVAQAEAGKAFDQMEGGGSLEVYMMVHKDYMPPELEAVDVHFIVVGVDKAKAESRRDELTAILRDYPAPGRLAQGPSYIEVGGVLGSQDLALQLFALGKVLGLWGVVTPEAFGFQGDEAKTMAGNGFVMIDGYRPKHGA